MALPWIVEVAMSRFSPKIDQISEIFGLGLGWEVWTQTEIAHQVVELEKLGQSNPYNPTRHVSGSTFAREKQIYKNTAKKCDFLISVAFDGDGGKRSNYFIELKCLRKDKLSAFIDHVSKDIDKVKNGTPIDELFDNASNVFGYMMAITVNPDGNPMIFEKMHQLARGHGIDWGEPYPLSNDFQSPNLPFADTDEYVEAYNKQHDENLARCKVLVWVWVKAFVRDSALV
jgi:hypothetical protein